VTVRRANAQLQSDRRAEILEAAERCFSRAGFHQASMHDICAEAGMSPGNLYRYFPSKESLIAGISERNRAKAAAMLSEVGKAPDFFAALAEHARHHLVDRSAEEVGLCAEIMSESRRNPEVARLYEEIEGDIKSHLAAMLRSAIERGEVRADLDVECAALVLMVLADGMSWRRAVEKSFDAERVLPMILHMVRALLSPPGSRKTSSEVVR
jgi:TetR/AcrR family transcriptional regulator, repressor for uid operon